MTTLAASFDGVAANATGGAVPAGNTRKTHKGHGPTAMGLRFAHGLAARGFPLPRGGRAGRGTSRAARGSRVKVAADSYGAAFERVFGVGPGASPSLAAQALLSWVCDHLNCSDGADHHRAATTSLVLGESSAHASSIGLSTSHRRLDASQSLGASFTLSGLADDSVATVSSTSSAAARAAVGASHARAAVCLPDVLSDAQLAAWRERGRDEARAVDATVRSGDAPYLSPSLGSKAARVAETRRKGRALRDEVVVLESRRAALAAQRDALDKVKRAIGAQQTSAASASAPAATDAAGSEWDDACDALAAAVRDLTRALEPVGSSLSATDGADAGLLAHADRAWAAYSAAEERFITTVSRYMDAQFHQGLAAVAQGLSRAVEREAEPSTRALLADEVARLQHALAMGERSRARNAANRAMEEAREHIQAGGGRRAAEAELRAMDEDAIHRHTHNVKKRCEEARERLAKVADDEIGEAVRRLAAAGAGTASILARDHGLRAARASYFTSKQNAVVDMLVRQHARHRAVLFRIARERAALEQTVEVLQQSLQLVQGEARQVADRIDGYAAVRHQAERRRSGSLRHESTSLGDEALEALSAVVVAGRADVAQRRDEPGPAAADAREAIDAVIPEVPETAVAALLRPSQRGDRLAALTAQVAAAVATAAAARDAHDSSAAEARQAALQLEQRIGRLKAAVGGDDVDTDAVRVEWAVERAGGNKHEVYQQLLTALTQQREDDAEARARPLWSHGERRLWAMFFSQPSSVPPHVEELRAQVEVRRRQGQ